MEDGKLELEESLATNIYTLELMVILLTLSLFSLCQNKIS